MPIYAQKLCPAFGMLNLELAWVNLILWVMTEVMASCSWSWDQEGSLLAFLDLELLWWDLLVLDTDGWSWLEVGDFFCCDCWGWLVIGRGCEGVAGVLLFFMSLRVLVREVMIQQKIKKQTLKTHKTKTKQKQAKQVYCQRCTNYK